MLTALYIAGSIASICGLTVSLYVLHREKRIADEIHTLRAEEGRRHHDEAVPENRRA
jgi:hypothetical protein